MPGCNKVDLALPYWLSSLRTFAGKWLLLCFCHWYWMSPLFPWIPLQCSHPTWMQIEWTQISQRLNECDPWSRLDRRHLFATEPRHYRFFDNEPDLLLLLLCRASGKGTYQGKCGDPRVPQNRDTLWYFKRLILVSYCSEFCHRQLSQSGARSALCSDMPHPMAACSMPS